jgi:hypothetical protein
MIDNLECVSFGGNRSAMNLDPSWRLTITLIFVNLTISSLMWGVFYLWMIGKSDRFIDRFVSFDRRMDEFEAEIHADIQGLHDRMDARLRRLEEQYKDEEDELVDRRQ